MSDLLYIVPLSDGLDLKLVKLNLPTFQRNPSTLVVYCGIV
jgi:hypothetical protein